MGDKVNVGFLYYGNPSDVKYWSGTVSKLHSTLASSSKFEVKDIVVEEGSIHNLIYKVYY